MNKTYFPKQSSLWLEWMALSNTVERLEGGWGKPFYLKKSGRPKIYHMKQDGQGKISHHFWKIGRMSTIGPYPAKQAGEWGY